MVLSELAINIVAFLTGSQRRWAWPLASALNLWLKTLWPACLSSWKTSTARATWLQLPVYPAWLRKSILRRTILRDLDGINHIVPNGEIKVASNFTKQWSRVNLNISVSYDTDLDKAMAVINRVGKELAEDPQWAALIISPPKAIRVDDLGDSGIDIKVLGDTKPSAQWDVTGELRLRLKKAFDKEGIEIPWPHTKVYFGNLPPQMTPQNWEVRYREKTRPGSE